MKNILMIITKLSNGGAEKAISLLAKELSNNYNVKLVTFDNSNQEYTSNIEIIDLKTKITNNKIRKIINFILRIYKIKKIKKNNNIDYSISFLPGPNIINCLTRVNDKIIISVRNTQSKLKKSFIRNISNQISFFKSDKIVTVCDSVKEDILNTYKIEKNKLITIYNTYNEKEINNKKFEKLSKEEQSIFNNLTVITVGRLIEQKGQWHLIRAFRDVIKEMPDAKLIILGRGELKDYLQKVIDKNNLQKNVFLYGFKQNPYKYMYNVDLFVLPSLYEGMSNVILEAMACELPIIATDCEGGNKEILSNDYGILTDKCDEKHYLNEVLTKEEKILKENILKLLKDKNLRNNYKAKSKIRIKDFSKKVVISKWESLLESIF